MTTFDVRPRGLPVQTSELGDAHRQREQEMLSRYRGSGYLVSDTITADWPGAWVLRQIEQANAPYDPEFRLTEELVKHYGDGIDEQLWPMFANANSIEGMKIIAEQARGISDARARLDRSGLSGGAVRLATNIFDPVWFAGFALTGGLSEVAVGGAQLGRLASLARTGAVAGATTAAIESYVADQDPTKDGRDVAYMTLGAVALGVGIDAGVHAVGSWRRGLASKAADQMRRLEYEDVMDAMGAASVVGIERGKPLTPEIRRRLAEAVAADKKGKAYFKQSLDPAEQKSLWDRVIAEGGFDEELQAELAKLAPEDAMYRVSLAQQAYFDRGNLAPDAKDIADAAGAATAVTPGEPPAPPREFKAGDFDGSWAADLASTPFADQKLRNPFDYHAMFGRLEDDEARRLGYLLGPDPVLRDPSLPQGDTALEFVERMATREKNRLFNQQGGLNETWAAFKKTRGVKIGNLFQAEKAFGRELFDAVTRGGSPDPVIESGRKALADTFARVGEAAKRHGVRGFEDFTPKADYIPSMPSAAKTRNSIGIHGEDGVFEHVRKSLTAVEGTPEKRGAAVRFYLQNELTDVERPELVKALGIEPKEFARLTASDSAIDDELLAQIARILDVPAEDLVAKGQSLRLDTMAKGWTRIVTRLDTTPIGPRLTENPDALADLLWQTGLDPTNAADQAFVGNFISNYRHAAGDGAPITNRARRRTPFDLTTVTPTRAGELRWGDLLEDDALYLAQRYIDDMHGAMAETEVLRVMSRSMRPDDPPFASWGQLREPLRARILQSMPGKQPEADKVIDAFDAVFNHLRGRPTYENTTGNRVIRRLRSIASLPVKGWIGTVQATELAQPIAEGGVRTVLRNIPATMELAKMARKGNLPPEFFAFLDSFGDGFNAYSQRYATRFEAGGAEAEIVAGVGQLSRGDRLLHDADRLTSTINGTIPIDARLRIGTMAVAEDVWVRTAKTGKIPNQRRLAGMGLNEDQARRITAQINSKNGTFAATDAVGNKTRKINFAAWDDQKAAADLITAMQRWSGRVIVRDSFMDAAPWMHSHQFFNMLMQYRRFTWDSWNKALVSRLQYHDLRAGWSAVMGAGASAMLYIGRTWWNGQGRDDKEDYLEENLTPTAIARGSIRYAGWSSFLPDIVDTFTTPRDRWFDTRYSGLSSGLLSADRAPVPTYLARALTAPQELANSVIAGYMPGGTKQDLRAIAGLLPLTTLPPVQKFIDMMGDDLPDETDN